MIKNVATNSTIHTYLHKIRMGVLTTFLCLFCSTTCIAKMQLTDLIETKQSKSKLSHTLRIKEQNTIPQGKFVGYSHNFSKLVGLDLSFDTYLFTNKSENSFKWIVGVVCDLFKVKYQTDQTSSRNHFELISSYSLNKAISVKGYVSNKNEGKDEYKDYSVGIAYSVNKSIEISAGYADRELKKVEAESNLFLNINGHF